MLFTFWKEYAILILTTQKEGAYFEENQYLVGGIVVAVCVCADGVC